MDPVTGALLGTAVGAAADIFSSSRNNAANANLNKVNRLWNRKMFYEQDNRAHWRALQTEGRAYDRLKETEARTWGREDARTAEQWAREDSVTQALWNEERTRQTDAEQRLWSREDEVAERYTPAAIRARAEEAGFNPLLFTGSAFSSPGTGMPSTSVGLGSASSVGAAMGSSASVNPSGGGYQSAGFAPMQDPGVGSLIAAGFSGAADQMTAAEALAVQKDQLAMENQRLADLAQRTRFQPEQPGIFGKADAPLLERLSEGPIQGHSEDQAPPGNPRDLPPNQQPQVAVWTPWGTQFNITASEADQLMLKPGSTVPMGTMAELGGEAMELLAVYHADAINGRTGLKPFKSAEPDAYTGFIGLGETARRNAANIVRDGWGGRNDWWSAEQRRIGIQ